MSLEPMPTGPREPNPWRSAAIGTGVFVGLLWVIELIDVIVRKVQDCIGVCGLDQYGIKPREGDGLIGVVTAPLLHDGWGHLMANTVPALLLSFVVMLSGMRVWVRATATIWVVAGVGTWITGADHSVHIGASGLIFGWVVYLILRGFFHHNSTHIVVGIAVFLIYGSMLLGVLPGNDGVRWQGHLFGALGGAVAAWWGDSTRSKREQGPGPEPDPLAKYLN